MKKSLLVSLLLITVLIFTLVGCGNGSESGNSEGRKDTVIIAGSTSVQPLSEELATAFMDKNSSISVEVQGGGSGQGIKAIQEKIADFGAISRNVKDEEKETVKTEYIIAKDGVAIIVNPASDITDLSIEQIKKIYTGEIKNWKEVGGKDAPIVVVTREEGSGTRGAFTEITGVLTKDATGKEVDKTTKNALVQGSTGAIKQTVASTPNTIGYVSLGTLDDKVKAIKVEGIDPSESAVLSGDYKISRPFIYVTSEESKDAAKKFVDFILSSEGQHIVKESGFVPVK